MLGELVKVALRNNIKNNWFNSITFLGHRITTDGKFAVETYILNEVLEDTPLNIEIKFVNFIRENRKFDSLEALKEQIIEDIKECL